MTDVSALYVARWRAFCNWVRLAREGSSFKRVFVTTFGLVLEMLLLGLFYDAFRFLDTFGGVGVMIVHRMFSLFFLGVGLMVLLSSMVTTYAAMFRSEEVPFLLTLPIETRRIVLYKFLEGASMASWAFYAFIVPFVLAYAFYARVSPLFLLWAVAFGTPYLLLCCALGAGVLMPLVRWAPRSEAAKWAVVVTLSAAGAVLWVKGGVSVGDGEERFNMTQFVPGLRLAANVLLPSWWASEGMLALSRGEWTRGAMLWGWLASSAAVATIVVESVGVRCFYPAWLRVCEGRGRAKGPATLLASLDRGLRFLAPDTRAMTMKDVRTFFRDPVQWSQALVFFGLLGLYFGNLRALRYNDLPPVWTNAIAFLNVLSVSSVICSMGSRFVFPQMSLEGHGFWIVGMAPTNLRRVVLAKFGLAATVLVVVDGLLVLLSSTMLANPLHTRWITVALVASVSLGIAGLSTGMGAIFMDLKQSNPAAIVSGFGGTLNLVISLAYMLASIVPFGLLCHYRAQEAISAAGFAAGSLAAGVWAAALTVLAAGLPLALGIRSLRRREF
jgi:ABC-2 type transport system permease protein